MSQLKLSQPFLLLTLGYPGAGKSSLAKQLAEQHSFGWVHDNRLHYELFAEPTFSREEETIVDRLCDYTLHELLRTKGNIVFNGNTFSRNTRALIMRTAKKAGYYPVTVWIQTDPETAFRRRNKAQGDTEYFAKMPREVFDRYASRLAVPRPPEQHIVLSGKHNHQMQLGNLIAKLQMIDQPAQHRVTVTKRNKKVSTSVEEKIPERKIPEAPKRPTNKKRQRLDITRQIKIR